MVNVVLSVKVLGWLMIVLGRSPPFSVAVTSSIWTTSWPGMSG